MKSLKLFSGAALAVGLFATSAFAYTEQPTPWPQAARAGVPVVTKVVNPTRLPMSSEGATIQIAFTVDASGAPRDIRLLDSADRELAKRLIPAFAQWRFTPVQKNGVAVATRVVMPVKLIEGA